MRAFHLHRAAGIAIALTGLTVAIPAIAQSAPAATENFKKISDPSVFKAFGGQAGLKALMDDFMINLLADPKTRPFFENADQQRIKDKLVEQFCDIMQGGCVYQGTPMAASHAAMGVHTGEFYALVEDLQKAMTKHDVPFSAQNKLLAILAPMHREIITK